MTQFLRGALAMACVVAALFFARFWRVSRDRLFLAFSAAFWLFALNWTLLALENPSNETAHRLFIVRFLAFLVIIVGILDKNRQRR